MKNYLIAIVKVILGIVGLLYVSYIATWSFGLVMKLPIWINTLTIISIILIAAYGLMKDTTTK